MPFISSVSARQSGLLFANAAKLIAPLFGASSGAAGGYSFTILNYDSTATYSFPESNPATYAIGDTGPAGGKIFITPLTVGNTTGKYFEAAPSGSPDIKRGWASNVNSNQSTEVSGADGNAIGTGSQNTIDVVAQVGNVAGGSAAAYASDYTYGGFSDWFLPSRDELNQLYIQRASVGGFANDLYWSSSEIAGNLAGTQDFTDGTQPQFGKSNFVSIRPVRSFPMMVATQSGGLVTVTGLDNAVTLTVTVTISKNGWLTNSSSATGTSFSRLDAPTFGISSGATSGYTFAISNYNALNTYSFSVTNGGSATQSSGTVTVTNLADATNAKCTVTVSRSGFVQNSSSTSGTSFTRLATPTYSGYQTGATPGRFKFNISIGNYDPANTYSVSVSAGSFTRSGSLITVAGLSDNQGSTVYVTASRAGFATSSQSAGTFSAPPAPDPAGTYYYGPVYYASVGGVAGACGYNGVADGNYGIGLVWVSGPCQVTCGGDYCAGGGNCC